MNRSSKIRRALATMLGLAILLWAEAGLALLAGDRVMACHAMLLHDQAGTMAASDDADQAAQDSDAMPCCPAPDKGPVMAVDHPPCCSVSNDAERPVAFLVISEHTTSHPLDAVAAGGFAPSPAHYFGELRSADAPRFVKPVLELKTDLRV